MKLCLSGITGGSAGVCSILLGEKSKSPRVGLLCTVTTAIHNCWVYVGPWLTMIFRLTVPQYVSEVS